MPSRDFLLECLDYDPDAGLLRWRVRPPHHFANDRIMRLWNGRHAGKRAGAPRKDGYWRIAIDDRRYLLHRVIWLLHTGTDPGKELDHRNRDPSDNRFSNLRTATHSQNAFNAPKSSRGLPRGVYFDKARNRYGATCHINGRPMFLGRFRTPEDAHQAYLAVALPSQGEFHPSAIPE